MRTHSVVSPILENSVNTEFLSADALRRNAENNSRKTESSAGQSPALTTSADALDLKRFRTSKFRHGFDSHLTYLFRGTLIKV